MPIGHESILLNDGMDTKKLKFDNQKNDQVQSDINNHTQISQQHIKGNSLNVQGKDSMNLNESGHHNRLHLNETQMTNTLGGNSENTLQMIKNEKLSDVTKLVTSNDLLHNSIDIKPQIQQQQIMDIRTNDNSIMKTSTGIPDQDLTMYKVNIEDINQFLTCHEIFGKLPGDILLMPNVPTTTSTVTTNYVNTSTSNNVSNTNNSENDDNSLTKSDNLSNISKNENIKDDNVFMSIDSTNNNSPKTENGSTVAPGIHTCDICGKVFQFRYQLIVHRRYHLERKPFTCQVCGQAFTTLNDLTRHGKSHIGGPMFTCNVCFNVFANDASLERHMKRHSADKPFGCTLCQKTFARKEHLENHIRSHTGETPFRCEYCSKTFTRKEHMVNHVRKHTGETPHRCEICKKSFTRKEHYTNHVMWHTGTKN